MQHLENDEYYQKYGDEVSEITLAPKSILVQNFSRNIKMRKWTLKLTKH